MIPDSREGAPPGGAAVRLAAGNAALQREMSAHPFVRALAGGTIPDAALAAWAGQRRLLCLYERAALHALRSLGADRGLDALLARLVDDTEREPRGLAALLEDLGATAGGEPELLTAGYGSYVQARCREGLDVGLAAVLAVERFHLDTWTSVRADAAPGARHREWAKNWPGDPLRAVVGGLARHLDQAAAPGALPRLEPVYRTVGRFELAFWDMSWQAAAAPLPARPAG